MTPNRACQIVLGAIDNCVSNKFCDPAIADQLKVAADVLIQVMDEIEDIPNMKARIRLLETECAWLESGVWPKTKSDGCFVSVVQQGRSGIVDENTAVSVKNFSKREEQ